jgi:hypothetical protein
MHYVYHFKVIIYVLGVTIDYFTNNTGHKVTTKQRFQCRVTLDSR